ncbi:MAG: hypothetical protein ISS55_10665 [Dehalococcoidales bacterium]|nr:hypothetical protein [Dehalococcoidales bacterium]
MPKYAVDFRKAYDRGEISGIEMIKRVYDKAKAESEKTKQHQQLAIRGIRALFTLTENAFSGKPFPFSEIYNEAVFGPIPQTPSSGLWVWNDDHGCEIVGKNRGERQYWIKE